MPAARPALLARAFRRGRVVLAAATVALALVPAAAAGDDAAPTPSPTLVLAGGTGEHALAPFTDLLWDREGQIDILTVPAAPGFIAAGTTPPNLGYVQGTLWLRFRLQRAADAPPLWYLAIANPVLDEIALFVPGADGAYRQLTAGAAVPRSDAALRHRHFIFAIEPPPGPATYYMRVRTRTAVAVPLFLATPAAFHAADHHEQIVYGVFFGALLAVALYIGILFVASRERSHAWFVGLILSLGAYQAELKGIGPDMFWPEHRWVDGYLIAITGAFAVFCALGYLLAYFGSPIRWLHRAIRTVQLLSLSPALLVFIAYREARILNNLFAVIAIVTVVLVCLWLASRRRKEARFFLLGWSALIVGVGLLMLRFLGVLPYATWINDAHFLGSAAGIVFLAVALAERFRVEQAALHRRTLRHRDELERQVAARTTELSERNAELARTVVELEQARHRAEAASRAKNTFLAHMSHELRTPLNAIIGFSEAIRDRLLGPQWSERYFEYAVDIHQSGVHLLSLINDVLDLSKIEAGRYDLAPEVVALDQILIDCKTLVRERARDGQVDLIDRTAGRLPTVEADRRALKQILVNLLTNAIKFTPPGGRVLIEAEDAADGDGLALRVIDTGIGISSDALPGVFEPFARGDSSTSRKVEGTGLGLAISRRLAEMHQGRLGIASEPGQGTTATLWLPPARILARAAA